MINEISSDKLFILIILSILYFILCAIVNIYKTFCNILYSPMAKSLASYFLNSAFIIYYYSFGNDFLNEGKKNFFYFFINLLFSILIDLLGLVYNEFFILDFCGLSAETHYDIIYKSMRKEMHLIQDIEDSGYIYNNNDDD